MGSRKGPGRKFTPEKLLLFALPLSEEVKVAQAAVKEINNL